MGMWDDNWLPNAPFQAPFSKQTINPYPNAPSVGKPYCGANVLKDVEKQIDTIRPTDIYVTHPTDDHPDHSASSSFVLAALHTLAANGESWTNSIHLHYFIVHRGDWPVPQGFYPRRPLGPPAAFGGLDTQWCSLHLTSDETISKKRAIDKYVSQEEMMDRLLVSFVRTNEIFGTLPEAAQMARSISSHTSKLVDNEDSFPPTDVVAKDPIGDTDLRVFQPGGDVSNIAAAYDSKNLYVTVNMQSMLSRTVDYHLSLRPFDAHMSTVPCVSSYSFSPSALEQGVERELQNGVIIMWDGAAAKYVIPLSTLGQPPPNLVFVDCVTTFSQVKIDHTGYRPIFLHSSR